MTVAAFTNDVGLHYKYENVKSARIRKPGPGWEAYYPLETTDKSFIRTVASSFKSLTTKSDRVTPTPYGRVVSQALERGALTKFVQYDKQALANGRKEVIYEETDEVFVSQKLDFKESTFPLSNDFDNAKSESVTKALNKLGGGKADLGIDLITAKQAVRGLSSLSNDAVRALLYFKRSGFAAISQPFLYGIRRGEIDKWFGDKWLELQFGLIPTYHQIGSYCDVLNATLPKPLLMHGKSTKSYKGHGTRYLRGVSAEGKSIGQVKTHLCGRMSNPYLAGFNDVGLLNPLSVAWELVPYSFVVDWFAPVGQLLSGLSATAGLSFEWGYTTQTENQVFEERIDFPTTYEFNSSGSATRSGLHYIMNRNVYRNAFPLPELYAKANPFSTAHVLDALALIRQL